jgi:methylase of polypeptide subunit release factors
MNNNTYIHKYIKPLLKLEDITIDMTLGNGNDSELLCQYTKKVYGFDISSEAIENSKKRLKDYHNIIYINDNHINVDKYVKEKAKLIIFNLGYLPHSTDTNITKADETLIAFKKSYELLIENGYIIITFYLGHKGGKQEYYLLDNYIKKNKFLILETYHQDKINSPITYIIKKVN